MLGRWAYYSDLRPGQSVLVYDETGDQIGQGALGPGTTISSTGYASYGYGDACLFSFSVPASSADSYRVVVGQRNGVVFTSGAGGRARRHDRSGAEPSAALAPVSG